MKVEFETNSPIGEGNLLIVQYADFIPALKDDSEFDSLDFATTAFYKCFNIDWTLLPNQCKIIEKALKKNSSIIFTIEKGTRRSEFYPIIYVLTNSKLIEVEIFEPVALGKITRNR